MTVDYHRDAESTEVHREEGALTPLLTSSEVSALTASKKRSQSHTRRPELQAKATPYVSSPQTDITTAASILLDLTSGACQVFSILLRVLCVSVVNSPRATARKPRVD